MADSIEAAEAKTKRVQALLLAVGMLITGARATCERSRGELTRVVGVNPRRHV